MRIDLNHASMPELERSHGSSGSGTQIDGSIRMNGQPDDVAKLATGSDAIETLKTKLNAVPEVRQQKVEALRQEIASGQYSIRAEDIADKMIGEAGLIQG